MSQITKFATSSGSGTVTSISAGHDITLTPNPITTTGTVAVDNAVTFGDLSVVTAGNPSVTLTSGDLTISGTGVGAAGNFNLPANISANIGNIKVGGIQYFSTYNAGNSGTNMFWGANSGNFTNVGATGDSRNIGVGEGTLSNLTSGTLNSAFGAGALANLSSGDQNYGCGVSALQACTSGRRNAAIGATTLISNVTGSYNTAIGRTAMVHNVSGSFNTAIGAGDFSGAGPYYSALANITSGNYNVAIGSGTSEGAGSAGGAGSAYSTSESSNICIGPLAVGVNGESNVIRIGASGSGNGQQNACYIAGVNGVTTGSPLFVTIDSVTEQLGTSSGGGGGITTINGDTGSVTGSTVTFSGINQGFTGQGGLEFDGSGTTMVVNPKWLDIPSFQASGGSGINGWQGYISSATGPILFRDGDNLFVGTYSTHQSSLPGYATPGNTAVGSGSLANISAYGDNTAIGFDTLNALVGTASGGFFQEGFNDAFGSGVLSRLTQGQYNIVLGSGIAGTSNPSGYAYTSTESSNILLQNTGVTGESNVMRLGTTGSGSGQVSQTYIAAIAGVTTVVADAVPVLISASTEQLGTITSSLRYKENIQEMSNSSSDILNLRPVTFDYKGVDSKKPNYGLIAEEVAEIFPDIVVYNKEGQPETVQYHILPALLLNELQKLSNRVLELELKLEKCCKS